MKIMVQSTVIYRWEEDSNNWPNEGIESENDIIAAAQKYADEDESYILTAESISIGKIEKV